MFDKYTGGLIGYLDLGDPDLNFANIEEEEELATDTLVFFIRGLSTNLKFNLVYFPTKRASALQIFHLFWEAVGLNWFVN